MFLKKTFQKWDYTETGHMICCLEFGVGGGGGGGGGLAALKEDPRGFIQKCKTKVRISLAVAENVLF